MKLLNKIFRAAGQPPTENIGGDSVTLSDSESVFLVGHKGIRRFTSDCISVRMRGYCIDILGTGLKIMCVTQDEALITGKIVEVKRGEG